MEKGSGQREIGQNKAAMSEKEKEENARSRKIEQYLKQFSQNEGARPINPSKLVGKPG